MDKKPTERRTLQRMTSDVCSDLGPTCQLPDQKVPTIQPQSSVTFPAYEAEPAANSAKAVQILILSPFGDVQGIPLAPMNSSPVRVSTKKVESIDDYHRELQSAFAMPPADSEKVTARWLLHIHLIDKNGQPLMLGKKVSEGVLYNSIRNSAPQDLANVRVFHLVRSVPTPGTEGNSLSQTVKGIPGSSSAACSGIETFRFLIQETLGQKRSESDWIELHKCVANAVSKVAAMTEPTADDMAQQLLSCCPQLKLVRVTGAPNATDFSSRRKVTSLPQCLDLQAIKAKGNTESQAQLNSGDCNQGSQKNVAFGIFIEDYKQSGKELDDRSIYKLDHDLSIEISGQLGCRKENILTSFDNNQSTHGGYVTGSNVRELVKQFVSQCRKEDCNSDNCLLFLSAHGCKEGFITSDGETIELQEIVNSLREIAAHVIVFYQPCRGDKEHFTETPPYFHGFSFPTSDISGCCLPSLQTSCSAIFASVACYASYRSDCIGSYLFHSIKSALNRLPQQSLTISSVAGIRQLAEAAQEVLQSIPDGPECCKQIQYAVQI